MLMRWNTARVIGLFFLLFGLLFCGIGLVWKKVDGDMASARTATAVATVVDIEARTHTDSDGDVTTSYYPVVEFEDSDHVPHRGTQSVSSGRYEVGDSEEVRYDPMNPEGNFLMVRDEGTPGIVTTIFVIMGAVSAFVGLVLAVISFL